jgi:hypothetical protein
MGFYCPEEVFNNFLFSKQRDERSCSIGELASVVSCRTHAKSFHRNTSSSRKVIAGEDSDLPDELFFAIESVFLVVTHRLRVISYLTSMLSKKGRLSAHDNYCFWKYSRSDSSGRSRRYTNYISTSTGPWSTGPPWQPFQQGYWSTALLITPFKSKLNDKRSANVTRPSLQVVEIPFGLQRNLLWMAGRKYERMPKERRRPRTISIWVFVVFLGNSIYCR